MQRTLRIAAAWRRGAVAAAGCSGIDATVSAVVQRAVELLYYCCTPPGSFCGVVGSVAGAGVWVGPQQQRAWCGAEQFCVVVLLFKCEMISLTTGVLGSQIKGTGWQKKL